MALCLDKRCTHAAAVCEGRLPTSGGLEIISLPPDATPLRNDRHQKSDETITLYSVPDRRPPASTQTIPLHSLPGVRLPTAVGQAKRTPRGTVLLVRTNCVCQNALPQKHKVLIGRGYAVSSRNGLRRTAFCTAPLRKHCVHTRIVLVVPLAVVTRILCKFGLNLRRVIPVIFVPTPPKYLARPRVST